MTTLTEQLREALTPDEKGSIHLSHEILTSILPLLDEHERLERESEAWKTLAAFDVYSSAREGGEVKLRKMTNEERLSFLDGMPQEEPEGSGHDMAEVERWKRYYEDEKRKWLRM